MLTTMVFIPVIAQRVETTAESIPPETPIINVLRLADFK
jgi:hypothetical protein